MSALRAFYLGMAAMIALAVWFVAKTRDPSPPAPTAEKSTLRKRRDELIDARNRIRRQMRILKNPMRSSDYTAYSAQAIQELQAALDEVEYELKNPNAGQA